MHAETTLDKTRTRSSWSLTQIHNSIGKCALASITQRRKDGHLDHQYGAYKSDCEIHLAWWPAEALDQEQKPQPPRFRPREGGGFL